MSDTSEKLAVARDVDYGSDSKSDSSSGSECNLVDKPLCALAPSGNNGDKLEESKPQYREVKRGIWTVYYPFNDSWKSRLPSIGLFSRMSDVTRGLPVAWGFFRETIALGPALFAIYFMTTTVLSAISSMKLYHHLRILELIERPSGDRNASYKKFEHAATGYMMTIVAGWLVQKLKGRYYPIIQQRVRFYFKKRILAVQSRLDVATADDPIIRDKIRRAEGYFSKTFSLVEGFSSMLSTCVDISGRASVLIQIVNSRENAWLFVGVSVARSIISKFVWSFQRSTYYTMITDATWLRLESLFSLGTVSTYRQDILGDNLEGYINSAYEENLKKLGDVTGGSPEEQWIANSLPGFREFNEILELLPLILFAWRAIRGSGNSGLSTFMLVQQATGSLHATFSRMVYSGNNMLDVFANTLTLCEVLNLKPAMPDGDVIYPEEQHRDQRGMSIEFRNVGFSYPKLRRNILKNMSFTIKPGQLVVIVGENGCGKSTTISLLSRIHDCATGEILIDGRPIRDFKMSSVRAATCVMYQNYTHYPLTIKENILLGRPDSKTPQADVEAAAKLGGAYDFIQKLPLKFDTDLGSNFTGYSSRFYDSSEVNPFKPLVDARWKTKMSGGEWRRLALSKTYMRNTDRIRLLCYDEPSASLDPNAEYETFERIRSLQDGKTMIFVTHRFGHLTKHADLILYVNDGTVVEQGTHTELLALGGKYAKMYLVQSQAFS